MKKAFTLVELLVVIGLVALMIGVLTPALGRARERSQATVCLSQLRQIGLGVILYANANRGWFPQNGHAGAGQGWIRTLYAHGVIPAARMCPSDGRDPAPAEATSYATNNYTVPARPYTRLASVRRPSVTIYSAETRIETDHLHATGYSAAADLAKEIAVTRHAGSANYLFCDGHVAGIPFGRLQKTFTTPATSPFNPATAQ